MENSPLNQLCTHIATPAEQQRDPGYRACDAVAGEPCRWAARHDSVRPPAFHSERLEAALPNAPEGLDRATFREAVLESGLV